MNTVAIHTKPKVGQIVFSLNVGNAARRSPQVLTPMRVTSVGRKYFTAETDGQHWTRTKFHLENWREVSNYSQNYSLYETEQAYADEKETNMIAGKLGAMFPYGRNIHGHSLNKLRDMLIISQRTNE